MTVAVHLCSVDEDTEENYEIIQLTKDKLRRENLVVTSGNDVKANELEWKGVEELISKVKWVVLFYTAEFMNSRQGEMLEAVCIENALTKGQRNIVVLVPSHLAAFVKESVSVFPCVLLGRDDDEMWLDELLAVLASPPKGLSSVDICYNPQHVNMEFTTGLVDRKYHSEPDPVSSDNEKCPHGNVASLNYRKKVMKKKRKLLSEKISRSIYGKSELSREIVLKPTLKLGPLMNLFPLWAAKVYTSTVLGKNMNCQKRLKIRLVLDLSFVHQDVQCSSSQPDLPTFDGNLSCAEDGSTQVKVGFVLPKPSEFPIPLKGELTSSCELSENSSSTAPEELAFTNLPMLTNTDDSLPDQNKSYKQYMVSKGHTTFQFRHSIKLEGSFQVEIYENDHLCFFIKEVDINKILDDIKPICPKGNLFYVDSDHATFCMINDIDINLPGQSESSSVFINDPIPDDDF